MKRMPPGPRGLPLVGLIPQMRHNSLKVYNDLARTYGDICTVPLGNRRPVFIYRPDYTEQVLVVQHEKFEKGFALRSMKRLFGNGLLTSEGEFWRRQRRLIQPAFHRSHISSYGATMVEFTLRHIAAWRAGETRDVSDEMMRLTMDIVVKLLFGTKVDTESAAVSKCVDTIAKHAMVRFLLPIPSSWPTPGNLRADRAYRHLDEIIFGIINERRATGENRGDLLSTLIHTRDEDGSSMSPQQLRDEVTTLFLAGHETTALTLSWTWYLLAQNPMVEARLLGELRSVIGDRAPAVDDLPRLPFTDAVVRETLRLYPPAYIIGRLSIAPFELAGYSFPAGTGVAMVPWVSHRDARWFDAPLEFRPERWLDGLAERLPPYAYFPFGGGPRRCIGQGFAQMEAALLLATIAPRFRFRLVPGHKVELQPLVTLRPKHGIRVTIEARS
jgi:cytochrome P450